MSHTLTTHLYFNQRGQACDANSAFIALALARDFMPTLIPGSKSELRSIRRQAQSATARCLASQLLQRHHGYPRDNIPEPLPLQYRATGKPFLEMPYAFDISLAHSGPWAGCAIPAHALNSPLELGLDIEQFQSRDWQGYAELGVYHPVEMDWIMSSQGNERDLRALTTWCRKEAMLKAMGCGLSLPLREIGFDASGKLLAVPPAMGSVDAWTVYASAIREEPPEHSNISVPSAVYALAWRSN